MPGALSIALPLVLAAVLIASGVAKLRTPDDLHGWEELGVPAVLRQEWVRRLHPWAELALGAAVALLGGWLGVLAAGVAFVLMVAYTALVARLAAASEDASCACFGARRRVTRITVVRNVWLAALAGGAAVVIWTTPLLGGAVVAGLAESAWLISLVVAAVTTALVLWPDSERDAAPREASRTAPGGSSVVGDDDLDYIRTRTPAVPVTLADGTLVDLRRLAERRPILLLAVSTSCGWCESVYDQRGAWRELLPELDVRLLLTQAPDDTGWTERDEPQSLHDVNEYVRGSISDWSTPSAVLLGADGMLAGGPVTGHLAVAEFVDDIYESLHGERPPRAVESADAPPPAAADSPS